jgi:hypothetical protein
MSSLVRSSRIHSTQFSAPMYSLSRTIEVFRCLVFLESLRESRVMYLFKSEKETFAKHEAVHMNHDRCSCDSPFEFDLYTFVIVTDRLVSK